MYKRFPHFKQNNSSDCGPTSLRMIARHYDLDYSTEMLRKHCHITRHGVNLLGISEAAEYIGFETAGVKAEDVATVQVLENHEHIKALQDQVPPESAAINLKLKENAKGVWTKNMDLGAGAYGKGMLWDETLQTMYFGKICQS